MNRYLKAAIAFMFFSFLICTLSLPTDSIVSVADNSMDDTYIVEVIDSSTEKFYIRDPLKDNLVDSVVKLNFEVKTPNGISAHGSATGFSVAYNKAQDKSYVITNDHFCSSVTEAYPFPSRFYYQTHDELFSLSDRYNGKMIYILHSDPTKDLCIMLADGYIKPVKVASKNYQVKQMEPVKIIGAPAGTFPIILDTYVSNLSTRKFLKPNMREGGFLYLISEMALGGHSGSPVFNNKGQVIGVIFLSLNNGSGEIYGSIAIPLEDLREFLDKTPIKY